MKLTLSFILLLSILFTLQVNAYLDEIKHNEYYLDSRSKCTSSCGSEQNPFRTFNESITELSKLITGSSNTPTLFVSQGDYYGEDNKDININFDIDIISPLGSKNTIIDCQGTGYGFKITGSSNVIIKGLTIQNCVSFSGSAIYSDNILSSFEDIVFDGNFGKEGPAIYSLSSMTIISSCSFSNNKGEEDTSAIQIINGNARIESSKFVSNTNDIYCSNSTIIVSEGLVFAPQCDNQCQIIDFKQTSYCTDQIRPPQVCNNDNYCDSQIENTENCPSDCLSFENDNQDISFINTDKHPGWKLTYYESYLKKPKPSIEYPVDQDFEFIDLPHIVDFMGKSYPPVSGKLVSDISVTTTSEYTFKLDVKNLGAIVLINGRVLFDNYFYDNMPNIVNERTLLLSSREPYTVEIQFTAINDQQRDLSFYWKSDEKPEYTLVPSSYSIKGINAPFCGDSICNEDPESCLIDCYDQIEKECPAQSPPSKLQEFYGPIKDTLGQLINNQYIFSLPGVGYLSHGMDIKTGSALPAPLFSHTYCDNSSFSVVHAPHRGLVYSVPAGLHAQISPKCTIDSSTKKYSSSSQMAQSMSEDKSFSASMSASYGGFFAKVSVSASFSATESVKKAAEMEKKTEGFIYLTELMCETSKVHVLEPFKFHPKFIRDLALAYDSTPSKAISNMKQVIKRYGSLYYKSATLGGKLEQVSIVSNEFESSKSSKEVEKSMDMSFSVSASSKILPIRGSASMSNSKDSKTKEEQQQEYESKSKRSTMIVSGGSPGSYGEDDFNSFSTWARTVDMIPFPIDFSAGYIYDIIPQDWSLSKTVSAKKLWRDAEMELYREYFAQQSKEKTESIPKYIDEETISQLNIQETVYYFPNCFVEGPTILGYIDYDGTLKTETTEKSKLANKLVIASKNTTAIESVKFSVAATTDACKNEMIFYNLFTSRRYTMKYNQATESYNIFKEPVNLVKVDIIDLDLSNSDAVLKVTVIGSIKSHEFTTKTSITRTDSGEYIGDIKAVILQLIAPPKITSFSLEITYSHVSVTQSCPDGQSECIPKKSTYINNQGYTRIYESKYGTLKLNQNQKWLSVSPKGSL